MKEGTRIVTRRTVIVKTKKDYIQLFGLQCSFPENFGPIKHWIETKMDLIGAEFASFLFIETPIVIYGKTIKSLNDGGMLKSEELLIKENQLEIEFLEGVELINFIPFNINLSETTNNLIWKTNSKKKMLIGYIINEIKLYDQSYDFIEWVEREKIGLAVGFKKNKDEIHKSLALWFIESNEDKLLQHRTEFFDSLKKDERIQGSLIAIKGGLFRRPKLSTFLGLNEQKIPEEIISKVLKSLEIRSRFNHEKEAQVKEAFPKPNKLITETEHPLVHPHQAGTILPIIQNKKSNKNRTKEETDWKELHKKLMANGWHMERIDQEQGENMITYSHKKIMLTLKFNRKTESFEIIKLK